MSTVGQKLKEARIAKGLTLDDLQQTTKIQKRYLIAIEEGNYDALPGTFYVKAFVKQYAETVGLDPNEIVSELDKDLGTSTTEQNNTEVTSRMQKREESVSHNDKSNNLNAKLTKYLPMTIIVVVVIAILGTIYAVTWGNHKKAKDQQIEQTTSKVAVSTDVSKKKAKSKKSSKKEESSSKKEQKIVSVSSSGSNFKYKVENAPATSKITISATNAASWNAVYVNGAQKWEGTLQPGKETVINVPADVKNVTISVGNSKATEVKINDHKLDFLAQNKSMTVRKLLITLESDVKNTNSADVTVTNTNRTTNVTPNNGPVNSQPQRVAPTQSQPNNTYNNRPQQRQNNYNNDQSNNNQPKSNDNHQNNQPQGNYTNNQ